MKQFIYFLVGLLSVTFSFSEPLDTVVAEVNDS